MVVFIFQLSRSVLYSNKMCFVLLWQFCGRRSVTQLATLELVVDYFGFIFLSNIFSKNTRVLYILFQIQKILFKIKRADENRLHFKYRTWLEIKGSFVFPFLYLECNTFIHPNLGKQHLNPFSPIRDSRITTLVHVL